MEFKAKGRCVEESLIVSMNRWIVYVLFRWCYWVGSPLVGWDKTS